MTMSSNAAKKMDPMDPAHSGEKKEKKDKKHPPNARDPQEIRINMTDEGFETSEINDAYVDDTVYVVGAESMTVELEVTVETPTLLNGLSSNPFTVTKGASFGPWTINASGDIDLTTDTGGGGGSDILTIHVNP
jgi:hypothetical protein